MYKKVLVMVMTFVMSCVFFAGCANKVEDNGKKSTAEAKSLVIYTSMKDNLMGEIVKGFQKKHPEIKVEYKSAGAGVLMEQIAKERENGKILADIIWTSEIPDFYQMKEDNLLEKYKPEEFDVILNPFDDYDGSFTAARFGTLGIAINTDKIKKEPQSWEDIATDPAYKNAFGIADPALSGTAFMGLALLEREFGWDYIVRLKENGVQKAKGSGQVVDNTAKGNLSACLAVDYIVAGKIEEGAHLAMVYPKELVMVPSPVAIFKDTEHLPEAKLFVDYMLGREAQQKVAEIGTVPVRTDINMPKEYLLPLPQEALDNGIKVNYNEVLTGKASTLEKFHNLFQ